MKVVRVSAKVDYKYEVKDSEVVSYEFSIPDDEFPSRRLERVLEGMVEDKLTDSTWEDIYDVEVYDMEYEVVEEDED